MSAWTAILLNAGLKSTVVLGAAWLLAHALRNRSAATRHLVWTAAAAALLALPLLSVSMPALRVDTGALAPLVPSVTFQTTASAPSHAASAPRSMANPSPTPHQPWNVNLRMLIPILWAAGAAMSLAQMAAAWVVMGRLRRAARPLDDSSFFAFAYSLGIHRPVQLLETPGGQMPLSFGILRPAVFLPADAREWSEDRRRVVLLHELAHIRRGDLATQLIARTAVSLFWWNPLAWMAMREFVKERERAADDLVLTAGESATAYASELLDIARSLQTPSVLVSAAVAMARPSQLEGRLMAILDSHTDRRSTGPRAAVAAAIVAIALVAPFAALQAQDKTDPTLQPDVDATIRAATAQQNHDILDRAAASYTVTRKYDTAQQLLEKSLDLRARTTGDRSAAYAEGLVKLGALSAHRGKMEDALDFYSRAAALGDMPETVPALTFLANHALAMRDPTTAETFLDRALAVAPAGAPKARLLIVKGDIAAANGLPGVAELNYQQAIDQAPHGTSDASLAMETYARFLTSQGRTAEAESMSAQAGAIRKAAVQGAASHFLLDGPMARVGGDVSSPVLLSKTEPEYTDSARAEKISGTVTLSVVIGTDGQAHDITLAKSLGFGLDEMAAEAVANWQFAPAKKDGVPVPVTASIEVNFRLL
jgi:TonB family protein